MAPVNRETEWEGQIVGPFEGYDGGRVYELTNGTRWRQDDRTEEHVYRKRAKAKPLWEQSTGTRRYLGCGRNVRLRARGRGSRDGNGWGGERFKGGGKLAASNMFSLDL